MQKEAVAIEIDATIERALHTFAPETTDVFIGRLLFIGVLFVAAAKFLPKII